MVKIKTTVIPQEYLDKFPVNDLHLLNPEHTKIINNQNKVIYDNIRGATSSNTPQGDIENG